MKRTVATTLPRVIQASGDPVMDLLNVEKQIHKTLETAVKKALASKDLSEDARSLIKSAHDTLFTQIEDFFESVGAAKDM